MVRKQIDTAGKTENFFSRNVKLITFLICITVIFSPFVIVYIKDTIEDQRLASRPKMTVDELVVIAEKSKDLHKADLAKFADYCEESEMQGMQYAMYRIPILHERNLVLSVSFDSAIDYVFYFKLIDQDTREEVDLLKEAHLLEEFLTAQTTN